MPQTINIQDIENLEYNFGSSYNYQGKNVPRVTEIISGCISEDYLLQWANRLGFQHKSYSSTLQTYADYGTAVHEGIESYLQEKDIAENTPNIPMMGFKKWWDEINQSNDIKILGQEQSLSCMYYGGTYDLLLGINGNPWLVDFKTSNRLSDRYLLQLAAYRYMLKVNNIVPELNGVILLRLLKNKPEYEELVLDFKNPSNLELIEICQNIFFSMVYSFWYRKYLHDRFIEISRGR